ncbi:MAG: amylo-alpha-1,6-glucosidase [Bryobacteraceae bacterium]|nr:amylo-alpha-1,6-glucosidase [Bryobacteraceae bacterium]
MDKTNPRRAHHPRRATPTLEQRIEVGGILTLAAASITGMNPQAIEIPGRVCRDWNASSRLEWLETNGTGAFAMGTVAGANTRRYHGLLIASLRPPVERYVLLSRVEEEFAGDALGAAEYPGAIAPRGYEQIEQFRLAPFPHWRFRNGLEKQVLLVPGRQAVILRYRSETGGRLRLRPFFAFREYHSLTRQTDWWNRRVDGGVIRPYEGLPGLHLRFPGAFFEDGHWYLRQEYAIERERGLDFQEDLYTPGFTEVTLAAGEWVNFAAHLEPEPLDCDRVVSERIAKDAGRALLDRAADQFLVTRADGKPTIIAGYPWFTDWGRDTMISLPGLLIARNRLDEARRIMEGFLEHRNRGILPNRFPDAGTAPEYNTVDATLWLFPAVNTWLRAGGDRHWLNETFLPAAREILSWHWRGTWYGIRADPDDHLLNAGEPGVQLTWMDAKAGDWVVTPRHGKAVEINALWYNAVKLMAEWLGEANLEREAAIIAASFRAKFWNAERNCLFDVLGDARIRPNQLFAVSLPHSPLDGDQQRAVVETCERELLTPVGLRSLERGDPEYRGRYEGGPRERDGAYHQGTVWPWLMGPYLSAHLRVFGDREYCRARLDRLEEEMGVFGLGSLAEVYDGDEPHRPGGCPAQAWSVGEVMRVRRELEG